MDWDADTGELLPLANATEPLNSEQEIRQEIGEALRRKAARVTP